MIDLNQRAKEVHESNHKWWHDLETGERLERNKGELLMLVISEIAECMEYERKGGYDKHLSHRLGAEVEMADAYIRLLDYTGAHGIFLKSDFIQSIRIDGPYNRGEFLFEICTDIISINLHEENIGGVFSDIYDYCHKFGYDLEGAYQEKMAYNQTRKDHTKEARLAPGGKRW